jgi:DNA-binding ferritin-like protein
MAIPKHANQLREETKGVLWHTPVAYDPLRHGPPYLPGTSFEPVKLSSEQRAEVRGYVKQAAEIPFSTATPLSTLLGVIQAAAMVHQAHHWSTRGAVFYADHLLFERLYNESLEFVDQVAERAVGIGQPGNILAVDQARLILSFVSVPPPLSPDDMVRLSLGLETSVLKAVDLTIEAMESNGTMSHGISNLLEGVADKHESFVYLLRQRSVQETAAYSYDRV